MKIAIPQKMSNSGSIYDLASEHFDRVINLGTRYHYAVIMPSFYKHNITRHTTKDLACLKAKALSNQGYDNVKVLDIEGNEVDWCTYFWSQY